MNNHCRVNPTAGDTAMNGQSCYSQQQTSFVKQRSYGGTPEISAEDDLSMFSTETKKTKAIGSRLYKNAKRLQKIWEILTLPLENQPRFRRQQHSTPTILPLEVIEQSPTRPPRALFG